ncbi:DUF1684 domain-containing protein [Lacihabitans sp. LS3-19]|uniref:DUF1684 domain-containing protein n=1 Tax=Lacihabitans sp. LS3-19 TaxID=2487335 RepID=UPI0020CD4751|nr:DUF1684 domain-containing protein [Lacihabitans sp. LS3-19]MCP9769052.1 DUF1684 domain-containing protein [Lacihabitans sp. LS3-19]
MSKKLLILALLIFVKNGFCQDYQEILAKHRENYIKETHERFPEQKQDFFEVNTDFKFAAKYKHPKHPETISIPTSGVKIKDFTEFAIVTFKYSGKKYKITTYRQSPIQPMYKNLVFVLFKDLTAPKDTYGGGRYMDMDTGDFVDGKVILDFNKAYNPYCAFSDGWNCPIPPPQNHLKLRIEAGEKVPLTGH